MVILFHVVSLPLALRPPKQTEIAPISKGRSGAKAGEGAAAAAAMAGSFLLPDLKDPFLRDPASYLLPKTLRSVPPVQARLHSMVSSPARSPLQFWSLRPLRRESWLYIGRFELVEMLRTCVLCKVSIFFLFLGGNEFWAC